ncbi:MAG TPA: DUF72 domain-containing protein [Burkholderiaceae bacterium]|nr:DUF72 domain-containing protein [Burkholderiaceae bacterium]
MQDRLFDDEEAATEEPAADEKPVAAVVVPARRRAGQIQPFEHALELIALGRSLPARLRMGGSSWSYPGWNGLVWDGEYSEAKLAKDGLAAYARHPLFRSVCVDRAFYRALNTLQYARLAAQVPEDFRFVVKAPLAVTDATVRTENGRALQPNPLFLDTDTAIREFIQPALEGLGPKIGALVFQLSPLPLPLLADLRGVMTQLHAMLTALPSLAGTAPDGVVAVEVRDPEFLTPDFAAMLRNSGASFCLGLQAKMPPIERQLPMLRAMWPGPLVCRWNLNPVNGAYGYDAAERRYAPFDTIVDPDPETREALARVNAGTVGAGHNAYVTISNQAEGCAPLTAQALARAVLARMG